MREQVVKVRRYDIAAFLAEKNPRQCIIICRVLVDRQKIKLAFCVCLEAS